MSRDYNEEFKNRVQFIRDLVEKSGVDGIVFGNSGGKDSALVGILCKFARFHSNQGLILFICYLICGVLSVIPVINLFAWIIYVLLFIFLIMGVINAGSGKVKRLPFIGKFDLIK